jgi:hypothetical protein
MDAVLCELLGIAASDCHAGKPTKIEKRGVDIEPLMNFADVERSTNRAVHWVGTWVPGFAVFAVLAVLAGLESIEKQGLTSTRRRKVDRIGGGCNLST